MIHYKDILKKLIDMARAEKESIAGRINSLWGILMIILMISFIGGSTIRYIAKLIHDIFKTYVLHENIITPNPDIGPSMYFLALIFFFVVCIIFVYYSTKKNNETS